MQPIVVSWDGGVRFTADVRGHKVRVDQTVKGGGEDTAPTPLELLPTSLGTCVALFVQQFLATRNLDPTGMTVEITSVGALNPHRIGRFSVAVKVPGGVPEVYHDALRRAAESCTVHHTLTHGPEIEVVVMEGAGVGV